MQDSILTTVVKDIDGEVTTLEKYAGNVLLIVNVASKCGLTPQYEQLENIQKAWADRGFVVLGFPCNQFLEQERSRCSVRLKLMAKDAIRCIKN